MALTIPDAARVWRYPARAETHCNKLLQSPNLLATFLPQNAGMVKRLAAARFAALQNLCIQSIFWFKVRRQVTGNSP